MEKVIDKLKDINDFRSGRISESEFEEITKGIFKSGFVWPLFLFHIAKPCEYPIADQNVFRAFSIHKNRPEPRNWGGYKEYIGYFFEVAKYAGIIDKRPKENESETDVMKLKKVDNALLAFGQFLKKYNK